MGKPKYSRKRKHRRRRTIKNTRAPTDLFYGGAKSKVTLFSKDELEGKDDGAKLQKLLDFGNSRVLYQDDQGENAKSKEPVPLILDSGIIQEVNLDTIASLDTKPKIIGALFPYLLKIYSLLLKKLSMIEDTSSKTYKETKGVLLYCLQVLREIYLFVNPAWYDELYYYYYYLNLDMWFDFFQDKLNSLGSTYKNKRGAKYTMNVYRSSENDKCLDCKDDNRYFTDFRYENIGEDNIRDINHILNHMFFFKDKENPVLNSTNAILQTENAGPFTATTAK